MTKRSSMPILSRRKERKVSLRMAFRLIQRDNVLAPQAGNKRGFVGPSPPRGRSPGHARRLNSHVSTCNVLPPGLDLRRRVCTCTPPLCLDRWQEGLDQGH